MSLKINGIDPQWSSKTPNLVVETSVRLAGEEAKDRLYEPKHKKKLVRVLTVIAYVFFVSLAAIMLSLYYVFLWNGDQKIIPKYHHQVQQFKCHNNIVAEMQKQMEIKTSTMNSIEENSTWIDVTQRKNNYLIKKIFGSYKFNND